MRSTSTRIALAVGGIAARVVLFAVLSGGSDDNSNTRTVGKPGAGDAAELVVKPS